MRRLKFPAIITIIFTTVIFSACSKPGDDNGANGGLTPFDVTVLQRTPPQAIISWSGSTNLGNNTDTVKYKIFINNNMVATGLTRLTDTIRNLSGDTLYTGKVLAYTSTDTISAPFVLNKINEYIFFNSEEHFEAFNLYSGIRMWNNSWNIYFYDDGGPTVSNDTIFFANRRLSIGNTVYAYKMKTGNFIWSAIPTPPGDLSLAAYTNPVYDKGKIILGGKTSVTALNSATGQVLWNYPHGNDETGTTPVCANNKVFVAADNDLVALNETTGAPLWHFAAGRVNKRPLVVDNLLIFGTNKKIYALNQDNGNIVWQKDFGEETYEITPILSGNLVMFFVEYLGFYGLNKSSGTVGWHIPNDWTLYVSSVAGAGKYFYYDYTMNKLVALNASNGSLLWERSNITSPISSGVGDLVYANNKIYCAVGISQFGAHGQLASFNAITGQQETRSLYNSDNIGIPTIKINDTVYYSADHGNYR